MPATRAWFNDELGISVWKAICKYLQKYIPPACRFLEIDPGYCDFVNQIQAGKKYAIDSHAEVSKLCSADVIFLHAHVPDSFPLPDRSVDVVFASNFLEHRHGITFGACKSSGLC
jgi:hypothetical protein